MKSHRKTLLGSLLAFMIGSSCCWLSALAIWIGGAAVLGTIAAFIEEIQIPLLFLGSVLALVSLLLYSRN